MWSIVDEDSQLEIGDLESLLLEEGHIYRHGIKSERAARVTPDTASKGVGLNGQRASKSATSLYSLWMSVLSDNQRQELDSIITSRLDQLS